ncbi:hypothetical protein DM793_03660 [Paenarthrobacter nitroguajacolicus]|uniref:cytochrome P450 n=1 Tax=Paenarthrobacter nitroguajacolicus TaxID=211146 RepID=UPI0015B908E0|nr:cytochrome P450 [Paenarthrobacter nitroguajacolicus]NWL10400.1 hypothetical protein [Paenarthrobacter nitroguajacolicus]
MGPATEKTEATNRFASFDHHDASLDYDQIWTRYRELLAESPLTYSQEHGGFWVMTKFEDIVAAGSTPETFSSASAHLIPMNKSKPAAAIDFDEPEHGQYRALFFHALKPKVVKSLEPDVKDFIRSRLTRLVANGQADFVAELALPLPLWMLSKLTGMSTESVGKLRSLTEASWERISQEPMQLARAPLYALMKEEYEKNSGKDNFLGWLHDEATMDGQPVTEDEALNVLVSLAVAGHETTLHAVGNLIYQLALDPSLQQRIRTEPGIIPAVVEESLRLRAPAQLFGRKLTRTITVRDTTLNQGDRVLLAYAAGNRDPDRFEDPESFNPDRSDMVHLSFGWGIHGCVGAGLARMEMRTLLSELRELPTFELAGEPSFSHLEGGHHLGPSRLPIRFLQ